MRRAWAACWSQPVTATSRLIPVASEQPKWIWRGEKPLGHPCGPAQSICPAPLTENTSPPPRGTSGWDCPDPFVPAAGLRWYRQIPSPVWGAQGMNAVPARSQPARGTTSPRPSWPTTSVVGRADSYVAPSTLPAFTAADLSSWSDRETARRSGFTSRGVRDVVSARTAP